jgi:hypothetical protein
MILIFTKPDDKEIISLAQNAISIANLTSVETKIIPLEGSNFLDVSSYAKEIVDAEACIIDIDQMKPLAYAAELGSVGDGLLWRMRRDIDINSIQLDSRLMMITRNSLEESELVLYFKDFYSSISLKNGVTSELINGLAKWIKDTIELSKPKVFISYRSSNAEYSRKIVESLSLKGALVWFDEFKVLPGDSIPEAINRGISWSTHMILIIDESFFDSKWTKAEMDTAIYRQLTGGDEYRFRGAPIQRPLIPLFLVDPSLKIMPPLLQRIRGLDCRNRSIQEIIDILWLSIITIGPR